MPCIELRMLCLQVDITIITQKFQRKPLLALAPKAPAPDGRHHLQRQVIAQPIGGDREHFGLGRADLFLQLAKGGRFRVFSRIHAALRHLPGTGRVDALPDEDLADVVEKHNPEAGGYYVVYEDGYKSFSPAKAFEEGYTRI